MTRKHPVDTLLKPYLEDAEPTAEDLERARADLSRRIDSVPPTDAAVERESRMRRKLGSGSYDLADILEETKALSARIAAAELARERARAERAEKALADKLAAEEEAAAERRRWKRDYLKSVLAPLTVIIIVGAAGIVYALVKLVHP